MQGQPILKFLLFRASRHDLSQHYPRLKVITQIAIWAELYPKYEDSGLL